MLKNPRHVMLWLVLFCCTLQAEEKQSLIGKIEEQRYTAIENIFSVALPFEISEKTRNQVKIHDRSNGLTTAVAFSHTLPNRPVYRMEVTQVAKQGERRKPFLQAAYDTLGYYQRAVESGMQSSLTMLDDNEIKYLGKDTLKHIFRIKPANQDYTQYHIMYMSDYNEKIAFCWVNFTVATQGDEFDSKILEGNFPKAELAEDFCRSLRL